jgi:hypothetical protein
MSSGLCETDPIWDWVPTILLSDFRALLFFLSPVKILKKWKNGCEKGVETSNHQKMKSPEKIDIF